ncbi:MAG TPA: pyrroloquinoline quinone-dependent dehydrogenase [Bryobacteraceae bacterium]|nr:pyrroloquinoline quinone-dependent dehydrogenase [Bryobacteraceae bacterium]
MSRSLIFSRRITIVALFPIAAVLAQQGAKNGEWRTYGGDLGSTRYSPLTQIDASNFKELEIAWRFKTDNLGPRPEYNFQSTPLMVNGILYTTAGTRRDVVALDAATGEMLWMHSENEGKRGELAVRKLSGRGLAYWSDGREARILYVTPGYRLIALDAKTGVLASAFGQNGVVDLRLDDDQEMDLVGADIGYHAAPVVAKNTVIVGAAHLAGRVPKSKRNIKGYVRGYDVRTGKRLWIFHTVPTAGEFGLDTWENDSWSYTGNTGVWGQITVDDQLGIVYLPVETPTGDEYGGSRPGNGLFGESLVALDLKTGQRIWHYQFIHHGIWDWDLPCAPILADITVDGKKIKAIAQPTKQAWLYVFDRTNGKPVWPIEERPVPQSETPGEKTSLTQPFPTKPPPFDRQGVSLDDLIDFTPELKAAAARQASRYRIGPIFTPAVVSKPDGPLATLMLPSTTGGANWPGGSLDPDTGFIYVYSKTEIGPIGLVKPAPGKSDMDWVEGQVRPQSASSAPQRSTAERGGEGGGGLTVMGLPMVKPPWGRITAIDLNKGDIVWQVAHGETPDNVRTNPALRGITIQRTGRPGLVGTLVTKTLMIAGEAGFFTTPSGQRGAMLRAYDKATGTEVGAVYMPAPQTGSPMTYMLNGKQYIVIAIAGANYAGELLAFRLPG